ncbi:MAG: hypothetical protein ABL998_10865 [Planctomycetota bacterium]
MKKNWILGLLFGGLSASCGVTHEVQNSNAGHGATHLSQDDDDDGEEDGEEDDDDEEKIALDQVPAAVKKAAEAAVAGFVAESAEKETEEGALHYCIHGHANGEFVEIEVNEQGKVLEIERGEDED